MRLRNVKNKVEIMNSSNYLITNPFEYIGKWNNLFNNNNPIYIEIGMGKGKFIIENAIKNPNINFIGIERYDSVICRALEKIPDSLNNLYMVRMNAFDIDNVFSKEVERIYLNFSDPWPKERHASRRLSSEIFLKKYENIFKNDNNIYMRTDNSSLFIYSLVSFSNFGYKIKDLTFDLHSRNDDNLITTEYEDKFSEKGMPIYSVVVNK